MGSAKPDGVIGSKDGIVISNALLEIVLSCPEGANRI